MSAEHAPKKSNPHATSETTKETVMSTEHAAKNSESNVTETVHPTAATRSAMSKGTHAQTNATHIESAPMATASPPEVAPTPTATAVAAAAPAQPASTSKFIDPPPPLSGNPQPPAGFVSENVSDFRGVLPRSSELNALPLALKDLSKFTDYAQVIGGTAPSLAQMTLALTVTNEWSATRTQSAAWDAYCKTMEGVAWQQIRPMLDRLRPAFLLAVAGDSSLSAQYPGLATLLGAKMAIANKAAATRKKNKPETDAGKPPTHGKVGKAATKKAEKAALAAQLAAQQQQGTPTAGAGAAPQPPVTSMPAVPVANGVAAAPAAPAVNASATPVNGATNGAAH